QDAAPQLRARGPEPGPARGQRYGEMEFWVLMAHGAVNIASELLSLGRSTARWMHKCAEATGASNARKLAAYALNQFLSVVGIEIDRGQLRGPVFDQLKLGGRRIEISLSNDTTPFPLPKQGRWEEIVERLEDEGWFERNAGLVAFRIEPPATLVLPDDLTGGSGAKRPGPESYEFVFRAVPVIPPWLRPRARGGLGNPHHPLTRAYARLISRVTAGKYSKEHAQWVTSDLRRWVQGVLGEKTGVGKFLRREVLGRRLTRSARAVIVPRPDLRIDQIAVPQDVLDTIFEGLPDANRQFVVVHRNPTLHRYGLLAMRPVADECGGAVFGLPLGVLSGMGADFDGDQATIVALETEAALQEAERLLPGAAGLRADPYRDERPAFPLCKELADPEEERRVAADRSGCQAKWCAAHQNLVQRRIEEVDDGWDAAMQYWKEDQETYERLWTGWGEDDWLQWAKEEMEPLYRSVRAKGRLGGVFRRHFYRQPFESVEGFWRTVRAMQAVTERLAQSSLSIKTGAGAAGFPADQFFRDPHRADWAERLGELDKTLSWEAIHRDLPQPVEPQGLLAWLARPTLETLIGQLAAGEAVATTSDPRIAWFLE
ncbi:MAG TPA: hypothetical protein EYH34_07695, partial [Planctomycetes bacterium]|nr:hypothetical protein [Planctomycetota bacterium]